MLLIGAFATDLVGAPKTIEGSIHGFATKASFSLFPIAIFLLALNFKKDTDWQHLYRYSIVTCILAVLLGITLQFFEDGSNYFGLVERILVANMIIWVEVMAINLLRLSLKRSARLDNQPETS
jgi:L-lactate permease